VKTTRPSFELQRINTDGSREEPIIVPVSDLPLNVGMDRRGLFGAGLTASGLLAVLDGCGPAKHQNVKVPQPRTNEELRAHEGAVTAIAVAPDGSRIVSSSADGTTKEWPYPHGGIAKVLDRRGVQGALALTAKGGLISQPESSGNALIIQSTSTSATEATISGHAGRITCLAVSPRGNWLGSVDTTGKVLLSSLDSYQRVNDISALTAKARFLAFPNDETLIIAAPTGEIDLWSVPAAAKVRTLPRPKIDTITAFAVSPNGQYFIVGDTSGHLLVVSLKDGTTYERILGHQDTVGSIAVTPDGSRFISAGRDGLVKVWSFSTRKLLGSFMGHRSWVHSIALGPLGDFVISGDDRGIMIVWSWTTYRIISYFFDPAINYKSHQGSLYTIRDGVTGRMITYVMPCGSQIPVGATCTCNCVGGDRNDPMPVQIPRPVRPPEPRSPPSCPCQSVGGGRTVCTCNLVCKCLSVCTCLAIG